MTILSSILGAAVLAVVVLGVALTSEPDDPPKYPPAQPFSAEQLKAVHEIRDSVADLRGLPVADIGEGTLDREVLGRFYQDALDELNADERREVDLRSRAYQLLGLIGEDDDLAQVSTDFNTNGIAGFYVPWEKRMVVIGDQLGFSQELTIAHEYVHSFQDARYDIVALRSRGVWHPHTELARTSSCVIEGDATLAGILYMTERHGTNWILQALEDEEASGASVSEIPPAMLRYYAFNYVECQRFVFEVYDEDGWAGVDALYERLPMTSEQILHPKKYFSGEDAMVVDVPDLRGALGPGWRHLDGWTFGEFDVLVYLEAAGASRVAANRAAEGWGGGRLELYGSTRPESDDAVVVISLAWDTEDDLSDFRRVLESIHSRGRQVPSVNGDAFSWSLLSDTVFAAWTSDTEAVLVFASEEQALERVRARVLP